MMSEEINFIANISDNDTMWEFGSETKCVLSAAVYFENSWAKKTDSTARGIAALSEHLVAMIPELNHWIFMGHSAWRPKNRITHYKKLWRYLSDNSIELPIGDRTDELAIESDKGIKYFGAIIVIQIKNIVVRSDGLRFAHPSYNVS